MLKGKKNVDKSKAELIKELDALRDINSRLKGIISRYERAVGKKDARQSQHDLEVENDSIKSPRNDLSERHKKIDLQEEEVAVQNEELRLQLKEVNARSDEIARVNAALRESEEKFRALAESTNAGIVLFRGDRYIYVNPTIEKALGYTKDELLAMNTWDIMHPDSRELVRSRGHARLQGLSVPSRYEVRVLTRDGETLWAEYSAAMIDYQGQPTVIATIFDITEWKRAEEALRESEEQFRATFNQAAMGIAHVALDGHWLRFNQKLCDITGYTQEELSGRKFQDITHPEDLETDLRNMERLIAGEIQTYATEKRYLKKDGSVVWVNLTVSLLHKNGKPEHFISVIQDITERKQAEKALQFERLQLLSIFDSIDEVIYVADPYTHEILYANRAMQEKFGKSLTGGICYREIQNKDAPCEFCTNDIILLSKGKPYRWEYHNPTVNRDFDIVDRIIQWPDGRDVRFEIAVDITEHKRTEEALIKDRHILTKSQEAAHVGNWAWNLETGELTGSAENDRIFGYNPGELEPTIEWLLSCILPEDHAAFASFMEARIRDGQRGSIDYRITKPDGSVGYVNTIVDKAARDRSGKITRLYGISQDVTERKQAEIIRSETERKLRGLIERSPDGITMVNEEGVIVVWNEGIERISGLKAGDVLGKHIWEIQPAMGLDPGSTPEEIDSVKALAVGMLQTDTSPLFNRFNEREIRRPDGTRRMIQSLIFPIKTSKGNMLGSITRDITERKQAEEEINAAKEQAELYLDLMGHDISNMHQIILGNLELAQGVLDADGRGESMEKDMIDISLTTLQRSVKLIENIRNVQKLRLGEYRLERTDLGEVLDQTIEGYVHFQGRDISINYEPVHDCYVQATSLIRDIFNNLIDNAVKHCVDPVRITVSLAPANLKEGRFYRVTVEDNGRGVPDNKKTAIFTRSGRSPKTMGTGLGLYLVRTLVEGFGGKVWVEDRVPGDHTKGARFVVLLPAVEK